MNFDVHRNNQLNDYLESLDDEDEFLDEIDSDQTRDTRDDY